MLVRDADINVVTGLLKLYFRELPESLFTDHLYYRFQEGMSMYIVVISIDNIFLLENKQ